MMPDPNSPFTSDAHFEVEVRRIARLIWPQGKVNRSPLVEGYERDAIVETPDIITVIEATTSRRKEKTTVDAKKTNSLVKKIRSQGFSCQGFLVTLHEPTAEQEEVIKQYRGAVQLHSFDELLSRLFDASQYLQARLNKAFGSIQNPKDEHFELGREFYIPIPILDEQNAASYSARDIGTAIRDHASRFVMVADFGSGKSMSLREIFYWLRDEFIEKHHKRFPVYINLRDHSGAKYPDEILERHARDLGLADYGQLVKAWRAGFVDLLLDGFDEFAATGWSTMPIKLRQIRRAMLEAVRKLIAESPRSVGIMIAGRQHYFDSTREMRDALGLSPSFATLRIELLSEEDAEKIVKKYGGGPVPDWVPSRALLLSYLAAKEFLKEIPEVFSEVHSRGHGWDALLKMISDREARQHPAIDGDGVLAFLERLASIARRTNDGLGSFSESDLSTAFEEACGFSPDDSARVLISRLPALASAAADSGRRRFIDPDIADAARAGDICRFIIAPHDPAILNALKEAQCTMGSNGVERLSHLAETQGLQQAKFEIAAEQASNARNSVATLDILQLMMGWNLDYRRPRIDISEIQFNTVSFDDEIPDFSRVTFVECVVENLFLSPKAPVNRLPRFEHCLIGSLDGISRGELPSDAFHDCEVQEVSNAPARNAAILDTDLPLAIKILLTTLNKLFNQAGSGRKENAFYRGLDPRARGLVPQVLATIAGAGFATPTRIRKQTIWLPRRDKIRRVTEIMDHPNRSKDPLIERVRNL
jgi:hypothetical protein